MVTVVVVSQKAHEELKEFVKSIDSNKPVYARALYGVMTFKNDLDEISKNTMI